MREERITLTTKEQQRAMVLTQVVAVAWTVAEADDHGIQQEVVKHPEGTCGFVLRPRRWVVERSLPGRRAFVGSCATMSGSPPP